MLRKIQMVVLLCFGLGVMIVLFPSTAAACSCAELPSVEQQLEWSEAVFTGVALRVDEKNKMSWLKKSILFEVKDSWKGTAESQVRIVTGSGGGDCGFGFIEGEEYLVYAKASTMYGSKEKLTTIICDRTTELKTAQAQGDLALLGPGDAPTIQVNLDNSRGSMVKNIGAIAIILIGITVLILWRRTRQV